MEKSAVLTSPVVLMFGVALPFNARTCCLHIDIGFAALKMGLQF
jgi:hypothetical protein